MVRSSQKRVYGVQNSQLSDKSGIGAIKGCLDCDLTLLYFCGIL